MQLGPSQLRRVTVLSVATVLALALAGCGSSSKPSSSSSTTTPGSSGTVSLTPDSFTPDFAVMAQEYSEDPKTASGGGDMGFVPASSLDSNPQLKRALHSLKVGQISPIIRTTEGFHIVKLLGREEPGQHRVSDPQVQSAIRRALIDPMARTSSAKSLSLSTKSMSLVLITRSGVSS